MSEEEEGIAQWIAQRRENGATTGESLGGEVMERVRRVAATPSFGDTIAAAARNFVPRRRRGLVYLGGSAFAGGVRVCAILYFFLGVV